MKRNILKMAIFSGLLFTGMNAQALMIDITPTADGDVQIFGGNSVNTTNNTISFMQSGGLIRNAILEFDLSSLGTAPITSASLDFTLTDFVSNLPSQSVAQIDIFAYNGDGVVDIFDYNTSGTQVVDSSTPKGGAAGDVRSFTFTDLAPLNDALIGGNLSLRIETDNFAIISFASLENTTHPAATLHLKTSPVPVPAAVWLFGSGLMGLFGVSKKKRS